MDIAPATGTAQEVRDFCAQNYRPEWHRCTIPPWPSVSELREMIPAGLVWEARENRRLLGIVCFMRAGDALQPYASFYAHRGRARVLEVGGAIIGAAGRVVLPPGRWADDPDLRALVDEAGVRRADR